MLAYRIFRASRKITEKENFLCCAKNCGNEQNAISFFAIFSILLAANKKGGMSRNCSSGQNSISFFAVFFSNSPYPPCYQQKRRNFNTVGDYDSHC